MPRYPLVKQRKAEFARFHGPYYELIGFPAAYIQIKSAQQKKCVHRGEPHTLVAVEEGVIVDERLEQRCGFFAQIVVVASLRTKDGGLQRALIAQAVDAAIFLNLVMMDGDDFSHRQVDALGHYLASFLYSSRYFSLERR